MTRALTSPRFRALNWHVLVLGLALCRLADAQPAEYPTIGFLAFDAKGCHSEAFQGGLRRLGLVENKNFSLVCHHADGNYSRLDGAARELVRTRPDVLVVFGHAATQALQRATRDIPIVMLSSGEPVASGFAQSLSRPGGNMTGVTDFTLELNLKRLELLRTAVPSLRRLAVLVHTGLPEDLAASFLRDAGTAGRQLGFGVQVVKFTGLDDLPQAFDAMKRLGAQALLVAPMREVPAETRRLVELSYRYRLPTMHLRKSFVIAGGLMSYGVDYPALHQRTALYVQRILAGEKPGDLPIEQPSRFEFYINSSSARNLGLLLPESLLLRADKVIESRQADRFDGTVKAE